MDSGVEGYTTDVQKALNELGSAKIKYIVNTHSDGDHIFGNPQLGREAIIIAHENCRKVLMHDKRVPNACLPTLTLKDELNIYFGDEVIHLVAMPCHTEDDIIVHFQKSNILCVGDIIFTDSFSTIHVEKNGNLDKLVQVLKDLQTRYSPDTKVIVGHGEDITVADIAKYEKMTKETIAIVRKAMQKNMSVAQMKTGEILKDWRSWESQLFDELNCDLWIQNIVDFDNKKSENKQEDFPPLKGPYLDQKPPGNSPELFAPGIVSTRHYENSITLSPDGNEICFAIASPAAGRGNLFVILLLKKENDRWSRPQVAPFSGKYIDGFPCFSPDGTQLFFASYRPVEANTPPKKDWDIWVVDRTEHGWSQPQNLGPIINTGDRESSPSVTVDGTLYFKRSGSGLSNIYRSRFINGHYEEPEKLSDAINSETSEDHPFIAPDESYILFSSWRRPDGYGEADLYISFRQLDGSWTQAKNMGNKINTNAHENCPFVSQDGRYLFFNSYKKAEQKPYWVPPLSYDEVMQKLNDIHNGFPNIYWVDAKVIEELKPAYLK